MSESRRTAELLLQTAKFCHAQVPPPCAALCRAQRLLLLLQSKIASALALPLHTSLLCVGRRSAVGGRG